MASEQMRSAARSARRGRLRSALPAAGQGLGAVLACGLWLGLASPGLQLLPGVAGLADESIDISLQSAMLGIADGTGRPASAEALAAADVLGLSYGELLAVLPEGASPPSGIVRLDGAAAELVRASRRGPDEGSAAEPLAQTSQSDSPAAAEPPPPPPEAVTVPVAAAAPAAEPQAPAAPKSAAPRSEPVEAAPALLEQSVEFDSVPPAEPVVGGSYVVTASATSGLQVKLSVSGGREACRLSGSTVSFRRTGTCVVTARQAGNDRYAPADARQELEIGRAPQTVSFRSSPPRPALVGGVYAVSTSASSGLAVTLSASGACSADGHAVSLDRKGLCRLEAVQVGDESWRPARAEQRFAVAEGPEPPVARLAQTITFGSSAPVGAVFGGPDYVVSASASSGLAVSFSLAPSSAGVCALAGSTVSLVGVGTCTVWADQPGGALHEPAPRVQQSFAVAKAPQSVAFTSSAPSGATSGSADYAVSAAASSGLPVSFSLAPSSAGVCHLTGSTVSIVGAGTCTIRVDQAGNGNYESAPQAQQSFAVGRASQSVSFTSTPPAGAVVGDADYAVSAGASSGLAVSFSLAPSSSGVCSLAGSTVSIVGAGTCTILADQGGTASYEPAPQAQQSFVVGKASQTITITSTDPSPVDRHSAPYTITATASSGLPVTFSIDPSSADNCEISGATITFAHWGDCIVHADQAGDANYLPAPRAQQTIVVVPHV